MDDVLSRSDSTLHSLAITASLEARWEDSLKLNEAILQTDPANIDALNRSARAYFELGDYTKAQKFYNKVLEHDSYNPIAQKNLKIILSFKKSNGKNPGASGKKSEKSKMLTISPTMFLNEPGKTKIASLIKIAEPQKLSLAYCGMPVEMVIKNRIISISNSSGTYLGVLPDDLSFQIIRLISGGNKYEAIVKSVKVNSLSILIKETFRSKKFRNQPSFLESASRSKNEIISNYTDLNAENTSDEPLEEEP